MHSRETAWARLGRPLDVLVIGGGVTGAAVLLEASRRGLDAALVERGDFASGTSSRSSKLVHGGLRYLREGKLRLTRESVHEREALLREAPGLVEPMPFLMPQYRGKGPNKSLTQLGLALYDALSGQRRREYLDAAQTLEREPAIASEQLVGAHVFYDATTDDARLVLRLLNEAEPFGGVSLNYAGVTGLHRDKHGKIAAAQVRDTIHEREQRVTARAFVNATGVFADGLREQLARPRKLRPLRGSHLLLRHERLPLTHAVAFSHPADGRPVFAYPWMGATLVGTTDIDHREDVSSEPSISRGEFQYLLDALAAQFPGVPIDQSDIVSTFAGVRPVIAGGHADPSRESRDQLLLEEDGLITITGGKLTTFRPMALAALGAVSKRIGKSVDMKQARIFEDAHPSASPRLNGRYGAHAADVMDGVRAGDLDTIEGTETTWAELRYALRAECVVHLEDLLLRRTRLGLQLAGGGVQVLPRAGELCAQELGWDEGRRRQEISVYLERIRTHYGLPA
ncbi:MAG TPA: glycerol-3-phosphate dehydrogenase/oxidase [Candidatus Baltobacteraceae bacterium]|nr:glycerol-3-phosphate dehydrogenase/oxidase [Candidatus Baltobacteraceae bacterium]